MMKENHAARRHYKILKMLDVSERVYSRRGWSLPSRKNWNINYAVRGKFPISADTQNATSTLSLPSLPSTAVAFYESAFVVVTPAGRCSLPGNIYAGH